MPVDTTTANFLLTKPAAGKIGWDTDYAALADWLDARAIAQVTNTERDAILTPATGFIIFSTTDGELQRYTGSAWVSEGSITLGEAQNNAFTWGGTAAGTVDAITFGLTPALTAYAAGQKFRVISSGANTGAMTASIDGLAVTAIKKNGGVALVAGDVPRAGYIMELAHDGTDFELLNPALKSVDETDTNATKDKAVSNLLMKNILADTARVITNFSTTADPTVNSDDSNTDGNGVFSINSKWTNTTTKDVFTCKGSTVTAAVWKKAHTQGQAINHERAVVASHATTSAIWAALGNEIDFTGTETLTDLPAAPNAGASRILHLAAACVFTHGAVFFCPGSVNFTGAAGDVVEIHAISTTTFRLTVLKADGTAVIASGNSSLFFQVERSANQSVTTGVATKVQFDVERADADGIFDNTTNYRVTIPSGGAGKWHFASNVGCYGSSNDIKSCVVSIFKNGSLYANTIPFAMTAAGIIRHTSGFLSFWAEVADADYFEVYATVTGTSPVLFAAAGASQLDVCWFSGYRIQE